MHFQPIHGVFSGYPSGYPIGTSKTFNVRLVDQIVLWLSGIFFDTDSPNVFSTGSYVSGVGITEGFLHTDTLHANGAFFFSDSDVDTTPQVDVAQSTSLLKNPASAANEMILNG